MHTNTIPLEEEADQIRHILDRSREDLFRLRSEHREAAALLKQLGRRQLELEAFVDDHARVISSWRNLPAEMISEFALHASGHYTRHPEGVDVCNLKKSVVWVLSQVCHSWRVSMLSFRSLWAAVEINPRSALSRVPARAELVAELLRRSGDMPLSISFNLPPAVHDGPSNFLQLLALARVGGVSSPSLDFLDPWFDHSHRWKCATIRFQAQRSLLSKLSSLKGKFPCLEELHLSITPPEGNPDYTVDAFELTPRLQSLTLSLGGHGVGTVLLPYHQLKHYAQPMHLPGNHLQILADLASNVLDCTFRADHALDDDEPTGPDIPALLPCARTLQVHGATFLDHLTTPALLRLYLDNTYSYDEIASLPAFISRSSCPLQDLRIMVMDNSIMDMLRSLPTLTSLSVQATYNRDFISRLTIQNGTSYGFLPHLKSLTLTIDTLDEPLWDELGNMLDSRWTLSSVDQAVTRVTQFHLRIFLDDEDDDYWKDRKKIKSRQRRFDKLRKQGLEILVEETDDEITFGGDFQEFN